MITDEKIKGCAKSITEGMNLKKGDAVLIRGGTYAQNLLEEIGILCYKKGAQPIVMATTDSYSARIFDEIPAKMLEITPKHYLEAVKATDAYIVIEPFRDPEIQVKFPRKKIAARTKSNTPIRKTLYGEDDGIGKKWTYAGWPTPEAAKFYGIDYENLEHMIVEGIMVPSSILRKNTSRLASLLKDADFLRITDLKGTNFTCKIKGRRLNQDDGVVDEQDIKIGDLGNNLPAGELFIATHETTGGGVLFCPITIDRFTNKIIKNVTLNFQEGCLMLDECTAEVHRDQMIESFEQSLKIDSKEKYVRTTNIGELGIGCNPAIDTAIGYTLTDEKLSGSVHVAFGSNVSYGGTSKSCMHWDFVTDPSATITIVDTGQVVMKDGRID